MVEDSEASPEVKEEEMIREKVVESRLPWLLDAKVWVLGKFGWHQRSTRKYSRWTNVYYVIMEKQ